jgi:hypothetical protein
MPPIDRERIANASRRRRETYLDDFGQPRLNLAPDCLVALRRVMGALRRAESLGPDHLDGEAVDDLLNAVENFGRLRHRLRQATRQMQRRHRQSREKVAARERMLAEIDREEIVFRRLADLILDGFGPARDGDPEALERVRRTLEELRRSRVSSTEPGIT